MVDLPEHAGQFAIWQSWEDPGTYRDFFEINRLAPNVIGRTLVRWLSAVCPIDTAFRILISIALLATPLVAGAWLRRTGGNPWWALLCFPVGFGHAFFWGFVNFVIGIPAALLFLMLAAAHTERPTVRSGGGLFALGVGLFLIHPMIYGTTGLAAALVVALRRAGPRLLILRLLPLVVTVPLAAWWLHATRSSEAQAHLQVVWQLGIQRLYDFPLEAIGARPRNAERLLGGLVFLVPFLAGGRWCRVPWRYAPLVVHLGLYFGAPFDVLGTAFVYPRFAALVLPALLIALDWRPRETRWRQLVVPVVVAAWLLSLWPRFWGFQIEGRGLDRVIARMDAGKRMLYLPLEPYGAFFKQPVFLHSGMWYQVEKQGMVDFSFAYFFPNRFRYRADRRPPLPAGFEWRPAIFHWARHGGDRYDYFLVRASRDAGPLLFRTAPGPIELVARDGSWWLYRPAAER